jgi:hypothetical protein
MKTTLLLMSLGFLGYTLYNKYYKGSNLAGATASLGSNGAESVGRPAGNVNFNKKIESQIESGNGLTDESTTGIED